MSTARKVVSNTVWQILGKVFLAIVGLAVVKITTNYLTVNGDLGPYGQYGTIYEYLAMFSIMADLGLYTIAVKEMSETPKKTQKIIGNVLTLRTILVTTIMASATIIAFLIPKFNQSGSFIPYGVLIASISTVFAIINGTLMSVLQANFRMGTATISIVLGKLSIVGLMFYIVFYGYPDDISIGFYALVSAGVIGNLISLIITYTQVKKITTIRYRFDIPFWKKIMKESLPYGVALILNTIYFRVDSLLIYSIHGESELAIYHPAMKTLEQFSVLPLYFMNTVLPLLTKAIKDKSPKYKAIIRHSFDFLAALAVPMVVGGVVLAFPIVAVLTDSDLLSRISEGFYGTDIALKILMFAVFFQFLNVLFAFILISINKQYKLLYINAFGVLFNIVANLLLIPQYGFRAAATTSVVSELIILIITYSVAKKNLKFNLPLTNLVKIIGSAIVMGFIVHILITPTNNLIQNWNVLLLVFIGAIVYAIMLILTKTVNKDMLKLLSKKHSQDVIQDPQG